ncbi:MULTISPECIES: glycosyltransferase family 4 protein [unclassified Mucilaginibacter]|uniref:glycosyltransferase family 4 protein n=1 Tax=unclassified Mucilaginibacter TaxID=2617802 RepID=UPI002AC9695E|nr:MULTISPECIES: glycosyltransferase family 4 protein [unclassified Mucilaginibacter]MEB0260630.1 glycosyltransferase family 4 protein [Mucilaginibacter sp. 10I4]MEB0277485.1 glycosyltransferase family 4 protein [Mucilaginibacter sp. 10B2]MEB0302316.1 glycosyltransferase family 4 protein [Mucilaginibacter sp. 5C4]WPX24885.1 glycosyltransferase family 4 protein [Mucilaginibacter sp. 5C4]
MRLAIITTHPIQYYAPVFKLLSQRGNINIQVFYTWGQQSLDKHDPGFGKQIKWDVPLLEGYPYHWVPNTAKQPGSHHYKGIVNPGLITLIENYNPDALLVFGWAYQSHLKAIRHFKNRIPVLFRGDSTLLDETGGIRSLIKSVLLKWVYKHVNHAFYVGTNNKAYFKKFGLKETQLSFAPHATDNIRFAADRSLEAKHLRQNLGIGTNDLLILFAGKFENKKAPLLLLKAFLLLNKPNVHLLFTGNGILEGPLKAAQNKNVHFMDFQNQTYMPVVYQACNLFCLPSNGPGETWGLAVNEAMACNKAILVSDKVGCAIDLVKPGYNGAIFKSGDEKSLLKNLTELTGSANGLTELGKHSGIIIKNWDFTQIAIAIENKLLNETN